MSNYKMSNYKMSNFEGKRITQGMIQARGSGIVPEPLLIRLFIDIGEV